MYIDGLDANSYDRRSGEFGRDVGSDGGTETFDFNISYCNQFCQQPHRFNVNKFNMTSPEIALMEI